MPPRRIRVLIVNDSAIAQRALTDSLGNDLEIEVVNTAIDPYVVRDKILQLNPDILPLDQMPGYIERYASEVALTGVDA